MLSGPIQVADDGLRAELRIAAPVHAVFDHVSNLRNMETWWPEHPLYRRLRGDGGPGTLYGWIYRVRGFPFLGVSRVLTREPGQRFEYRAGPPGLGIRIGYELTPAEGGTRVRFWFLSRFGGTPAFAEHLVPEVTRALDRLAAHLGRSGSGA